MKAFEIEYNRSLSRAKRFEKWEKYFHAIFPASKDLSLVGWFHRGITYDRMIEILNGRLLPEIEVALKAELN